VEGYSSEGVLSEVALAGAAGVSLGAAGVAPPFDSGPPTVVLAPFRLSVT
jgi:hypothetical protein